MICVLLALPAALLARCDTRLDDVPSDLHVESRLPRQRPRGRRAHVPADEVEADAPDELSHTAFGKTRVGARVAGLRAGDALVNAIA
jgi:hypothetical protein